MDVRYLRGSAEQYKQYLELNKISDSNFYFITNSDNSKDLFLGKVKLSNQKDIENAILQLNLPNTYATKIELKTLQGKYDTLNSDLTLYKQSVADNYVSLTNFNDLSEAFFQTKADYDAFKISLPSTYVSETELNNYKSEVNATYATKNELKVLAEGSVKTNADNIALLTERVEKLEESDSTALLEKVEEVEKAVQLHVELIETLQSDVVALKGITLGIGGENEPSTIMNAIANAKTEMENYVNSALAWQDM